MTKVLQLCSKPPLPAVDGGCIAALSVTESLLRAGFTVKVFSIATHKHPDNVININKDWADKTQFESVFVNTQVSLSGAFCNLFSSYSYNLARFRSTHFNSKLIAVLLEFEPEVVILEGLYVSGYVNTIRKYAKAKIVFRSHNIEFRIWQGIANTSHNVLKKWYLSLMAKRLKKEEEAVLMDVNCVVPISASDSEYIKRFNSHTMVVHPHVGVVEQTIAINNAECMFIGSMEWIPNVEGIRWFLEKIWPTVVSLIPEAHFHLAGKSMPESLSKLKKNGYINYGELKETNAFWNKASILVVPLLSGSGLKIKVAEALGRGKIVLTTPIGAEGYSVGEEEGLIRANNEIEFSKKLSFLMQQSPETVFDYKKQKRYVQQNFSIDAVAEKWRQICLE